jgi:predicted RNase H-like nuclease (RuvC/YqgF family)
MSHINMTGDPSVSPIIDSTETVAERKRKLHNSQKLNSCHKQDLAKRELLCDLQRRLDACENSTETVKSLENSLKDALSHCDLRLSYQQYNHELESQMYRQQIAALEATNNTLREDLRLTTANLEHLQTKYDLSENATGESSAASTTTCPKLRHAHCQGTCIHRRHSAHRHSLGFTRRRYPIDRLYRMHHNLSQ